MEVKLSKKVLLEALVKIKAIIGTKHVLPILSSVLITANKDKIKIMATNLDVWFVGVYSAEVTKEGTEAIPYVGLLKYIPLLSDEIFIGSREGGVEVSDSSVTCNIFCSGAEDFPTFPHGATEKTGQKLQTEIKAETLKNMLAKTVFINGDEMGGLYITGVYFKFTKNLLWMASTNGVVLAQVEEKISLDITVEEGILVPKKDLEKLNTSFFGRYKEERMISLTVQEDSIIFRLQDETIIVRRLEADFPDFLPAVVREQKNIILINRKALIETLTKLAVMEDKNYRVSIFNIEGNTLKIVFTNPDVGKVETSVAIQYEGRPMQIGFVASQFIPFLSLMKSKRIQLDIIDDSHVCLLTGVPDRGFVLGKGQDEGVLFAMMPFRREEE